MDTNQYLYTGTDAAGNILTGYDLSKFGSSGVTGAYDLSTGNLLGSLPGTASNPSSGLSNLFGLTDWSKSNKEGLGLLGDIGTLGLGLAGYFAQKPLLEAQTDLLKQQIASNKVAEKNRADMIAGLERI